MQLVFATHNQNKYNEVKALMPKGIELLSLAMIRCHEEIAETGNTLEVNAKIKADFVTQKYGLNCFSDDSGLLIEALNGAPGVFSARYAGPQKKSDDNMQKVLRELQQIENRAARFETVIALNFNGESHFFKGIIEGQITKNKQGTKGFGYDPIFQPKGYDQTFAEMDSSLKNTISHRGRAIEKLMAYLRKQLQY